MSGEGWVSVPDDDEEATELEALMPPKMEVTIEVRNGCAGVVNKPRGVRVTIWDVDAKTLDTYTEAEKVELGRFRDMPVTMPSKDDQSDVPLEQVSG